MKFTPAMTARTDARLRCGLLAGHAALVAISIILATLTIGAVERDLAPDASLSAIEVAYLAHGSH